MDRDRSSPLLSSPRHNRLHSCAAGWVGGSDERCNLLLRSRNTDAAVLSAAPSPPSPPSPHSSDVSALTCTRSLCRVSDCLSVSAIRASVLSVSIDTIVTIDRDSAVSLRSRYRDREKLILS